MLSIFKSAQAKIVNWQKASLLQKCRRKASAPNGRAVLFWHHGGCRGLLEIEIYFALALQFRGYTPHFILCDGTASACFMRQGDHDVSGWRARCAGCVASHKCLIEQYRFSYSLLRELLSGVDLDTLYADMPETPQDSMQFTCCGKDLTENLLSGLIRYSMNGDLNSLGARHIKEFAFDAACNWLAANAAIQQVHPVSVFMSHCIFTDFGPAYKAAQGSDIHIFSYTGAHKTNHMYFFSLFKDSEVPGPSLSQEAWQKIVAEPWDDRYGAIVDQFYEERYNAYSSFSDMQGCLAGVTHDRSRLLAHYSLDDSKPIFAFFTQIRWDASADFSKLLFATYDEFILASLKAMAENPNVQWLIKIHPAEKHESESAQTEPFIRRHFPELPANITIVPYDSPFSPVDFFRVIDGAVGVCGTSGLEVAAMGKPVITAARYLYANRGFTYDGQTAAHFLELIGRAETLRPLDAHQKQLAQKYLVTYLYRQAIPIAPLSNKTWNLPNFADLPQLLPGNNEYIDLIMDAFANQQSPMQPID